MSLFDLTGRVAVITGSWRGIGRAAAERLAEQGANVVVSSRKLDACQAVADAINERQKTQKRGGRAIAVEANISSKQALGQLVERARGEFGQIDIRRSAGCAAARSSAPTTSRRRRIFNWHAISPSSWAYTMSGQLRRPRHHQIRLRESAVGKTEDRPCRGGRHAAEATRRSR